MPNVLHFFTAEISQILRTKKGVQQKLVSLFRNVFTIRTNTFRTVVGQSNVVVMPTAGQQ